MSGMRQKYLATQRLQGGRDTDESSRDWRRSLTMNRRIIVTAVTSFIATSLIVMAAWIWMTHPLVAVVVKPQPLVCDLGVVRPGTSHQHVFMIANNGPNPIRMRALRTSCGCTTSNSAMQEILSGVSVPFEMALQAGTGEGMLKKSSFLEFMDGSEWEPAERFRFPDRCARA